MYFTKRCDKNIYNDIRGIKERRHCKCIFQMYFENINIVTLDTCARIATKQCYYRYACAIVLCITMFLALFSKTYQWKFLNENKCNPVKRILIWKVLSSKLWIKYGFPCQYLPNLFFILILVEASDIYFYWVSKANHLWAISTPWLVGRSWQVVVTDIIPDS